MGRAITLNKEHGISVTQPKVSTIVDLGEDSYNELILPYIITTDSVFSGVENEEELRRRFSIFDLFFAKLEDGKTLLDNIFNGKNSQEVLEESLKLFLNAKSVRFLDNRKKIIVDKSYMIDGSEFNKLRLIVQDVIGRKDIEVEKPPKNMTKRQKDIWAKLQKGRRRNAEKNAVYMQDMVNYVSFGGKSFIPTEQIDNMTYWYFMNAYKSIVGVDAFNIGMGYKLSQKFDVKDNVKHWTDTIKIGK